MEATSGTDWGSLPGLSVLVQSIRTISAPPMTQKTLKSLGTTLALPTHDNQVPVTTEGTEMTSH